MLAQIYDIGFYHELMYPEGTTDLISSRINVYNSKAKNTVLENGIYEKKNYSLMFILCKTKHK